MSEPENDEPSEINSKMINKETDKKANKVAKTTQKKVTNTPKPDQPGVSSIKHNNTKATMLLYFCIMTVLMCCCLGRCLVVPLSQASKFELNSRKHIGKLDKSAFI